MANDGPRTTPPTRTDAVTVTATPPAQQSAVTTTDLSYRYPKADRPALDHVTLSVEPGEIFGVLGPNGSGKTTLFRLLTTTLAPQPDAGHAAVFDHSLGQHPCRVRQQLGIVFQHPSLDGKLTAEENLRYHARLYGLSGTHLQECIDHWLERFDLTDRRRDYVDTFSGGMRRRLEIAKALLHEPKLLLLDEPTTGLDPGARREVWRHLTQLRQQFGLTVILTTHLMDEAERCDRLAILSRGTLVAVDAPDRLKRSMGGDVITVVPDPAATDNTADRLATLIEQQFGPWHQGHPPRPVDGLVRFEQPQRRDLVDALRTAFPDRIRSVTVGRPTLEDVFLHLTGQSFWHGSGNVVES